MVATHTIDGLITAIKKNYNLSEFYDANLNFLRKDPACPDSITNYLSSFKSDNSLSSRIELHNLFGAVTYDAFVFYCEKDKQENVKTIHLGVFPSKDLYNHLEDADFFLHANIFAICYTFVNNPESIDPEIYIYVTE